MTKWIMVLLCCFLASGCSQTAAIYSLPRFSIDGEEVYAVKLEGDAVRRYGTEPMPASAREFPGDLVVAIDPADQSERDELTLDEIDWYRHATEGQWRYEPGMSEEAADYEKQMDRLLQEIIEDMPDRIAARQLRYAEPFPSRYHDWIYRPFDISPDQHYVVVENQGSLIIFDTYDGWNEVIAQYDPPGGPTWAEENAGLLIVGVLVVGIITAIIVSTSRSNSHRHHRRGGRRFAGLSSHR